MRTQLTGRVAYPRRCRETRYVVDRVQLFRSDIDQNEQLANALPTLAAIDTERVWCRAMVRAR